MKDKLCVFEKFYLNKRESGQTLLIGLLVMAVALTIGLSVISRSITDVRLSQQEEESARAFSAAEAGIEASLRTGVSVGSLPIGSGTNRITATVTESVQGHGSIFVFPAKIKSGEVQTLWLVEHNATGDPDHTFVTSDGYNRYTGTKVNLYWGNPEEQHDSPTTPALEATVFIKRGSNFLVKRGAFDPNSVRRGDNKFATADYDPTGAGFTVGDKTFAYRAQNFDILPLAGDLPYVLRLKLIYNNGAQALGITSDETDVFPSQGKCFDSCATVPESGVTRCVQQCNFYRSLPGIFDYVLFSENDLIQ